VLPGRLGRTELAADGLPEGRADEDIAKRDALYRRALGVADVLAAGTALLLGAQVLGDDLLKPWWFLALPLIVVVNKAIRLYDRDEYLLGKTTLDEAPTLFQAATLYALLLWLAEEALVDGLLGREQVLGLWALLFLLMLLTRLLARRLARAMSVTERCLVVGDPRAADRLRATFVSRPAFKTTVVGRVSIPGERRRAAETPEVGSIETLGLILSEQRVHRVLIAPLASDSEEILHAIRLAKSMGVKISLLPRLFEVVGTSVEFDSVDGVQLLGLRRGGLSFSSALLKRGMDLVGASIGLLLLSPLLVAIAVAVKLTSPGPVLFRQPRTGQNGERFEILKFRTMIRDAEAQKSRLRERNEALGGLFKIADDPRVTSVGRILRRTSLDELPQLLNVLRKDMSLVGPRPLVPDEDDQLAGWDRARLELRPGMTGYWQISGSSRIPMAEMAKIDYLYAANWSLWLDVKILLRTFVYTIERRGL
jgi:exopolysaccharide biosynthesis polyprenyl glycosylphosphotransferase